MKKIFLLIITLILSGVFLNSSNAACIQCPEIQKRINKEFKNNDIKLSKDQKAEIKVKKKEMKSIIKNYDKKLKQNQKQIDKILNADCPDIVKMMEIKNTSSKISKEKMTTIKSYYDDLFYVYTPEQRYIAKRVLSENSDINNKKPCIFCNNELKPKCSKCKNKGN